MNFKIHFQWTLDNLLNSLAADLLAYAARFLAEEFEENGPIGNRTRDSSALVFLIKDVDCQGTLVPYIARDVFCY